MSFQEIKGEQVYYTDKGKGRAVVFLHGFMESLDVWKTYAEELSKTNRVICIDLPGHGLTPCYGYVHTMELIAEIVQLLLKKLGVRKYVLIGHSMGGYVSLAMGEQDPDAILGICLFHSTAQADHKEKKFDRDRVIKVVKHNKTIFIKEAIPHLFYRGIRSHQKYINRVLKIAQSTSSQGIVAALEGMKIRPDREVVVRFTPYPIHYIIGKEDPVLNWEGLVKQSQLNEKGSYLLLEDVGHMGFFEAEMPCLKSLKTFLRTL